MKYFDYLFSWIVETISVYCFIEEEVKEHSYVVKCKESKPLIVETFKFTYNLHIMNPAPGEVFTVLYQSTIFLFVLVLKVHARVACRFSRNSSQANLNVLRHFGNKLLTV
uniref:Uncharacterized protein n=1 Tax=Glossina brevipalpis TaxID=37001 RepID=A0A1A9WWC4_9MUSC